MIARLSTSEARQLGLIKGPKPKQRHKYNARRTQSSDGLWFDSKRECERYYELRQMQRIGCIRWFCRQPRFCIEGGEYVADFLVVDLDGSVTVEDCKGFRTAIYRRSKKQMRERYGIEIVEV